MSISKKPMHAGGVFQDLFGTIQILYVNKKRFTIRMEGTELEEQISRLPKEEVRSVIGFDSILRPLNDFPPREQALLN